MSLRSAMNNNHFTSYSLQMIPTQYVRMFYYL